jgi:hypothetical protein
MNHAIQDIPRVHKRFEWRHRNGPHGDIRWRRNQRMTMIVMSMTHAFDAASSLAPVELNLHGKEADLVGLGSYLINAVGGCNDCHTADATTEFAPGGNPFLG